MKGQMLKQGLVNVPVNGYFKHHQNKNFSEMKYAQTSSGDVNN